MAMSKSSKRILLAAAGAAGLAVVAVVGVAVHLLATAKPRIAALASDALGMDVAVDGAVTVSVRRGLEIALKDVHLRKCGVDLAAVQEVNVGVAMLPLLHREVRILALRLTAPQIAIEHGGGARAAAGCPAASAVAPPPLASVVVSGGRIRYTDAPSGRFAEGVDCDAEIADLQLAGADASAVLKHLSLAAKVTCRELRTGDFAATAVAVTVAAKDGVADLDPVSMRAFGGQGSAKIHADFTGATPHYRVRYSLAQFRIEDFFNSLSLPHAGQGSLDFGATLSLSGTGPDEWLRSLAGEASLRGVDFRLAMGDVDQRFARYESSQNFNLVDVGAVFFLGPIGLGITKGLDLARNFQGTASDTSFQVLVSNWQVERGVAHAQDVAAATKKNRIALRGGLDFVTGRFDDVTVALVDAKGCPQVRQRVTGPFLAPVVEQPSVLKSLTGPERRLIGRVRTLLGKKCDVFYSGSVAAPKS
jgi:AsmA protein